MAHQKPLSEEQHKLLGIVKAVHQNLAVSRRMRSAEVERRTANEKARLRREFEAAVEEVDIRVKDDFDRKITKQEAALDEALIAVYNADVPVTRIATDGFGNRYPGGVNQLIVKLRNEGRLGSRIGNRPRDEDYTDVEFPEAVDVESLIEEATTVAPPRFDVLLTSIVLVEADADGENGVYADAVSLTMDSRDPWFKLIEKNARVGTPFLGATSATLYLHPHSGELSVVESKEVGAVMWDHPVARWVKEHHDEALAGFVAAREASE